MENYRDKDAGQMTTGNNRLFANIDKDLGFSFLSAAGSEFTDLLNRELHRFSNPWIQEEKVVFRGVRNDEAEFNPVKRLEESDRIVILVGDYDSPERELEKALACQRSALVACDGRTGNEFLDKHRKNCALKYLASQQHLLEDEVYDWVKTQQDIMPLGKIRSGFRELEPELRETECCFFNLSAIRHSDAPGKQGSDISGLTSEEACRLLRYFGVGDYSRVLWIKGFEADSFSAPLTANLIAQLVWYFLNGAVHRPGDYPLSSENLIEYTVSSHDNLPDIRFYKSRFSGRWWFSIGADFNLLEVKPCSYEDYLLMCEGEISDRIALAVDA